MTEDAFVPLLAIILGVMAAIVGGVVIGRGLARADGDLIMQGVVVEVLAGTGITIGAIRLAGYLAGGS